MSVVVVFNAHHIQYHIFADDKQLLASAPVAEAHEIKKTVERCVAAIKPLKVIENLGEDVTGEKLIALQGQDPSLAKFMKEAEENQKVGRAEVYFKMKDGILYRYCRNFEGREISQVVIPKGLREAVMTMAHDAVMIKDRRKQRIEFGENFGCQDLVVT